MMRVGLSNLVSFGEAEEAEGFGRLEVFYGVAGEDVSLIGTEVELEDFAGFVGEVDLFEIDPEGVWGQGRLEEIEEAFVVGDGAPACGGDVGLVRSGDSVGDRDVTDHTEDASESDDGVFGPGDGIDVERSSGEAVSGAIGTREHDSTPDLSPIGIES